MMGAIHKRLPSREGGMQTPLCLYLLYTVKPLKTATPWGMKNWPSYRGGRLIEVILLRILRASLHLGNEKVAVLQRWPS